MLETVRFETNVPQELVFAYDEGRKVEGRYGDQFFCTLEDGRACYLDPPVYDKIRQLGVRRGDAVQVTKREVRRGNRRSIDWAVELVEEDPERKESAREHAPSTAAKPTDEAARQGPNGQPHSTTPGNGVENNQPRITRLEDALRTVVKAVHGTRQFAKEIGFEMPVFSAEDIRTMANTLMIEGRNGGAR